MLNRLIQLRNFSRRVTSETGKSQLHQLMELLRLRLFGNRLGVDEYFRLGIFDDGHFPSKSKRHFLGWRASHAVDKVLNESTWGIMADDKIVNYSMLRNLGFPIPTTVATYSPEGRHIGNEVRMASKEQLVEFLTDRAPYPMFAKPVFGAYGRDTFALSDFDALRRVFKDPRGQELSLHDVVERAVDPSSRGMLFQEPIVQHREIESVVGKAVSCIRMIVILGNRGPRLRMAFWKVARKNNVTDNFSMGTTGNLLAKVDAEDGRVSRVVNGFWPEGKDLAEHPDSLAPLLGMVLPHWRSAVATCLEAAHHFPGIRLQGWDVAICDNGPVLVELNTHADLEVPEFLHRAPLVDAELAELIASVRQQRAMVESRTRRQKIRDRFDIFLGGADGH